VAPAIRAVIGRLVLCGVLTGAGLAACRSTPDSEPAPVATRIEVGRGGSEAVARRAAQELADAGVLAALAPSAGERDRRYLVRCEPLDPKGPHGARAFQAHLATALVGTGRFLLVETLESPAIRVVWTDLEGHDEARIELRGPGGDLWVEVRGLVFSTN